VSAAPAGTPAAPPGDDLVDRAPCGIIAADRNCRIVRANAWLAKLLGRAPEVLIGAHFSELLTIGSRLYYETHFAPLLRMSGSVSEVALDLSGLGGARIPVLVSATEHRGASGEVADVTIALFVAKQRRQYEQNLLAAKANAEDATSDERETSELREQLMAILGHDLRNPLAAISSGLTLLKRDGQSDRARRVIGLMEGSVVRASVLIDNVLDFARGRLGSGIELTIDETKPLSGVIEQVISEMRLIAPGRAIVAEIELPAPVPVDPGRMGQLVSNLLGNALTHGDAQQPVTLRARSVNDTFELSIANGGEPIPEGAMINLFRPFVRGKGKESQQGLGLGLYIASEIAKAHGGSLSASSTAEQTRFTFSMPLGGDAGRQPLFE
jgi:sigma-B regulation protein RsbU (phosphoserine phosphatase)